ncbi:unnamed protein product [marine sediment metagenome]|uniref:Uncharacterized protein n=1 Tax=marine sediment metagenome TaxID=412755 RepID=X0Z0G4_9ZZZZ
MIKKEFRLLFSTNNKNELKKILFFANKTLKGNFSYYEIKGFYNYNKEKSYTIPIYRIKTRLSENLSLQFIYIFL